MKLNVMCLAMRVNKMYEKKTFRFVAAKKFFRKTNYKELCLSLSKMLLLCA